MAQRRSTDPTGTGRLRQQFSRFYAGVWLAVAKQAATLASHASASSATAGGKIAFFDRQIESVAGGELSRARYDRRFGLDAMARSAYRAGIVAADVDLENADIATGNADHAEDEPRHREWLLALLLLLGSKYDGMVTIGVIRLRERYAEDVTSGVSQAAIERNQRKTGRTQGAIGARALVNYAVVRVFNDAILNRHDQAGQTHMGVIGEQIYETMRDSRVCPKCLRLEAHDNGWGPGLYTIEQARGIHIPIHPNCRCRWGIPASQRYSIDQIRARSKELGLR